MQTNSLEKTTAGTSHIEKEKQTIKVQITFVKNPLVDKMTPGTVFFKRDDPRGEFESKLLTLATEQHDGKIDLSALEYLLKRYGWLVTNQLNPKQFKTVALANRLKKKVFSDGLKNIYSVKRLA